MLLDTKYILYLTLLVIVIIILLFIYSNYNTKFSILNDMKNEDNQLPIDDDYVAED